MRRAKILTVSIEQDATGLWHATSPQMRELFVSGKSIEEVRAAVPAVVKAIYGAHGEDVRMVEASDETDSFPSPWVVVPCEQLKEAC